VMRTDLIENGLSQV